jgi:hypothetical protein
VFSHLRHEEKFVLSSEATEFHRHQAAVVTTPSSATTTAAAPSAIPPTSTSTTTIATAAAATFATKKVIIVVIVVVVVRPTTPIPSATVHDSFSNHSFATATTTILEHAAVVVTQACRRPQPAAILSATPTAKTSVLVEGRIVSAACSWESVRVRVLLK